MSSEKKADFSNVQSGVKSTESIQPENKQADFSNVQSSVQSTEAAGTPAGERSYTVEKGDTLSAIAKAHYGKASKWRAIFEANRDTIDDPDRIFPGQVIKIPALDADGDDKPD